MAYAYAYVVFTGTVVYAIVNDTPTYADLSDELGAEMTIHGVAMVLAGLGFGYAVLRARTFPRWTAVAAGVRDLGWAGMGAALMRSGPELVHRGASVGRS